jgi:cell division protein FtsW
MDCPEMAERRHDNILFAATCVLVAIGLVMIYSVSVGSLADINAGRTPERFLTKQLAAVVAGMLVCVVLARCDPRKVGRVAPFVFLVALLGLMAVFVHGWSVVVDGKYHRWLKLPGGLTFQPSALAPVALVVLLAELGEVLRGNPSCYGSFRTIGIVAIAVTGVLVLAEPDLGSCVLVSVVGVATLAASGLRSDDLRKLLLGCVIALALASICIPYMRERLVGFMSSDPGKPNMQVERCLTALGAGGVGGRGLGEGITKFGYLPEARSDTIFAAIGEELGFRMTFGILLLYGLIVFRGYGVAVRAETPYARSLAFGLTTLIGLQATINMLVVTGLLPTTGLPLPFVSACGTSALILLGAVGLILSASRRCVAGPVNVEQSDADRPLKRRHGRAHLSRAGARRNG